jgi:hypothetical protein
MAQIITQKLKEGSDTEYEGLSLDDILEMYQKKADELTVSNKAKVTYEYFLERENGNPTGKVFVAYVKQPHILAAAKCMDMIISKNLYQAGAMLWEICVLPESDSEVKVDGKYKLGLEGRLGLLLEVQAPEDKKK